MHQPFAPILVLRSVTYKLPSLTHFRLGSDHTTCYMSILIADLGNIEIPTLKLTASCSASELQILLLQGRDSNPRPLGYEPSKLPSAPPCYIVESVRIELTPLIFQTSVRTSYTKIPICGAGRNRTSYHVG